MVGTSRYDLVNAIKEGLKDEVAKSFNEYLYQLNADISKTLNNPIYNLEAGTETPLHRTEKATIRAAIRAMLKNKANFI